MNFIVIGGGPTGVEMAGAIAELAKGALVAGFCPIDARCARIVLVEAGPWLLAPFDPSIGFRNRLTGAVSWCWSYVSFQRGARLITGIRGSRIEDVTPAGMIAPALAPNAENCGSVPVLQALRQDNLNRQGIPQF
jgi:Pyridine nucleotide-disulphide oxidoreductase